MPGQDPISLPQSIFLLSTGLREVRIVPLVLFTLCRQIFTSTHFLPACKRVPHHLKLNTRVFTGVWPNVFLSHHPQIPCLIDNQTCAHSFASSRKTILTCTEYSIKSLSDSTTSVHYIARSVTTLMAHICRMNSSPSRSRAPALHFKFIICVFPLPMPCADASPAD
jgi:hypothetical protein